MLNRRGFTLVELLISIILLAIVGLATSKVVRTMMAATTAQVEVASAQGNARVGVLAIPQELREIGYDTIPATGATDSDLEAISDHRLTIRAGRGMGISCGTPTLTEFRILKPITGVRQPLITDRILLFLDNDPNYGADDQWVPMVVASIDYNSTCGADSAIAFTLASTPIYDPSGPTPMAISQFWVGSPIKWYERVEYGPVVDGTTGQAFIGVRSLSLSEATLTPTIGPLPDTSSFSFTYYNSAGTVLDPSTALPIDVRSIGLDLITMTTDVGALSGTTKRSRVNVPVSTRVALRNAIRP